MVKPELEKMRPEGSIVDAFDLNPGDEIYVVVEIMFGVKLNITGPHIVKKVCSFRETSQYIAYDEEFDQQLGDLVSIEFVIEPPNPYFVLFAADYNCCNVDLAENESYLFRKKEDAEEYVFLIKTLRMIADAP